MWSEKGLMDMPPPMSTKRFRPPSRSRLSAGTISNRPPRMDASLSTSSHGSAAGGCSRMCMVPWRSCTTRGGRSAPAVRAMPPSAPTARAATSVHVLFIGLSPSATFVTAGASRSGRVVDAARVRHAATGKYGGAGPRALPAQVGIGRPGTGRGEHGGRASDGRETRTEGAGTDGAGTERRLARALLHLLDGGQVAQGPRLAVGEVFARGRLLAGRPALGQDRAREEGATGRAGLAEDLARDLRVGGEFLVGQRRELATQALRIHRQVAGRAHRVASPMGLTPSPCRARRTRRS